MKDSTLKLMEKKMDYQLKWIIANEFEYDDEFVLAAQEELGRRRKPEKKMISVLLGRLFHVRMGD